VFGCALPAANLQILPTLPNNAVAKSIQLDTAGNIYVAGAFVPQNEKTPFDFRDAFVAKIAADGSKIVYFTILGGGSDDAASVLAVGPDGSVYVTGATGSTDFPITAGALQSKFGAAAPSPGATGGAQPFLTKLDPAGAIVYSTFLGGAAAGQGTGIALDSTGNLLLSGNGGSGFDGTSGAPAGQLGGWILRLDPTLTKVLLSINGYGAGPIVLDKQGNLYLAGVTSAGAAFGLPALPTGGFQPTHAAKFCFQSSGPSGFALDCSYQYVAKLDPAGTKLSWITYVTGSYGATPAGIALDSTGNVILAGTTNSDDYPVTAGSFQTAYAPGAPRLPGSGFPAFNAPNITGYITKLNAAGTALLWSTYFGGSYSDQITGLAVAANGDLLISGRAGSSDLPVLAAVPAGCRPGPNQLLGFVARLSADGSAASAAQPIYGIPDCLYGSCGSTLNYQPGWPIALRPNGTAVLGGANGGVASVDLAATGSRLACLADPSDNAQLNTLAPGQLLSIFGDDLAPAIPATLPVGSPAPAGLTVTFNGVAAPIFYTAAQQINVQVPFEIAGQTTVQMQVTGSQTAQPLNESRAIAVVPRQPAALLSASTLLSPYTANTPCGNVVTPGVAALALNADGTLNDCTNPAPFGSVITLYLDGLGQVSPAQSTGAITPGPSVEITPAISTNSSPLTTAIATTTAPGLLTGLTAVKVQLPSSGPAGALNIALLLGNATLRERTVMVWTR
jgi:uncharacterized protein (TIGR03437 family)